MDILESPNFDPHDKKAFPMLVSRANEERLKRNSHRLNSERERVERLGKLSAPEIVIEQTQERIKRYENDHHTLNVFNTAKKGLENILHHKYGQRRRSASERLLEVIFGELSSNAKFKTIDLSPEVLQESQTAIDKWKIQHKDNLDIHAAHIKRSRG